MKILVLSDTHAYLENARAVLARLQGKVDAVFHLGDHDDDAHYSRNFLSCRFIMSRGIMIIAWIRLRRSWCGLAEKPCS